MLSGFDQFPASVFVTSRDFSIVVCLSWLRMTSGHPTANKASLPTGGNASLENPLVSPFEIGAPART